MAHSVPMIGVENMPVSKHFFHKVFHEVLLLEVEFVMVCNLFINARLGHFLGLLGRLHLVFVVPEAVVRE